MAKYEGGPKRGLRASLEYWTRRVKEDKRAMVQARRHWRNGTLSPDRIAVLKQMGVKPDIQKAEYLPFNEEEYRRKLSTNKDYRSKQRQRWKDGKLHPEKEKILIELGMQLPQDKPRTWKTNPQSIERAVGWLEGWHKGNGHWNIQPKKKGDQYKKKLKVYREDILANPKLLNNEQWSRLYERGFFKTKRYNPFKNEG